MLRDSVPGSGPVAASVGATVHLADDFRLRL